MWLQYGVSDSGELVYINQVGRGATKLRCPYCNGMLLAKKGQIKAHHFAHAGESCRQVERSDDAVALPAYDNFNLHLAPKALKLLQAFYEDGRGAHLDMQYLEGLNLLTFNEWA